ncbi:MAG: HDOD domain-containing protein [Candidatus Thiodiazotropha sp. (ex Ctena orbiculata)]|nr:HDOD domain-containing protein [Candidatus Thiodiazotropha taylori]
MSQTVEEWVRQISSDPLPVMQRTLTQVRDLLNKSSVNHNRLSEVISRDPGFSLYVMQKLSQLPVQPKEPITRISLAIPMLGMELIEQASKTLPSLEDKLKGPPRRGLYNCYSRAAHAARYARGLAKIRNLPDTDGLYTGALLHEIGEMALWSVVPDEMQRVQRKILAGDDRESVAKTELGCTFETLNIRLSERWQLPDLIIESQGISNSFLPKPLSVMLSSAIARETSLGWQREKTIGDLELLAEFLEIPQENAISTMHRLAAEAARDLHTLPLPLPGFYIISGDPKPDTKPASKKSEQPAKRPPQPKKAAEEKPQAAPVRKAESSADKSAPETQAPAAKQQKPTAASDTPAPPAQKSNPLQEMLSSALQQMHEDLGLSRTMFAMLTPDRAMIRSRLVVESEQQLSLKGFALDTKKPSLFNILLSKPQAVILNKDNAEKYLPMIPQEAQEQINTSGFVSMSIFIRNKPVGLFYADNGLSGPGVTRQQFDNFKVICQKIMKTMGGGK